MNEPPATQATVESATVAGDEFYSIPDHRLQVEYVSVRRAARWVPFLLPHLKTGMRVLDCGCGVGSITLDLAEIVAPGETVGLDVDDSQLEVGRAAAAARGLGYARFEVGNVYELPFADASFDAVLAHTLLNHLSEPVRALNEMRRVLAPGGVAAVSDDDYSTWVISPEDPALRRLVTDFIPGIIAANGGNVFRSRNLRRLLLDAGFRRTESHAVAAEYYGTLEDTCQLATLSTGWLQVPNIVQSIVAHGWASTEEIESLQVGIQKWGERPDAFAAVTHCAALGWVDGATDPSPPEGDAPV